MRKGVITIEDRKTALINGIIITPTEALYAHAVIVCGNVIESIIPEEDVQTLSETVKKIDCNGQYILPGLIDIHSDMIENIIVPRKGIVFPVEIALFEADRQLIGQGITTIYHSISIANTTICNRSRTLSVNEMLNIGEAINKYEADLLIHHRFHARLELNTVEACEDINALLDQGVIHELSLMNHTPGQGQYASLEAFRAEILKQYGEISESRISDIIEVCRNKPLLTQEQINNLVNHAIYCGVPLALHDVETEDQLNFMMEHGIKICEFPLNKCIAARAFAKGLYCVVGAPNVLRNGSHNQNVSALDLLSDKTATILSSDYYSPALLKTIFYIPKISSISLVEAVKFATYYPACAVKIDNEYGSIAPGKKADLIIVNLNRGIPLVTSTFVDGINRLQLNYEEVYYETGRQDYATTK